MKTNEQTVALMVAPFTWQRGSEMVCGVALSKLHIHTPVLLLMLSIYLVSECVLTHPL